MKINILKYQYTIFQCYGGLRYGLTEIRATLWWLTEPAVPVTLVADGNHS
jgi:hypothetical protein